MKKSKQERLIKQLLEESSKIGDSVVVGVYHKDHTCGCGWAGTPCQIEYAISEIRRERDRLIAEKRAADREVKP